MSGILTTSSQIVGDRLYIENDAEVQGYVFAEKVISREVTQTSDRTRKKEIVDSPLGLDFVRSLRPVEYKWADATLGDTVHYGFIAQEVKETALSGAVNGEKDGEYTLGYTEMIAPLVKAVQQLADEKVKKLELENAALKVKMEALEAKTEALEAKMEADNKEFRAALRALQAKSTSA